MARLTHCCSCLDAGQVNTLDAAAAAELVAVLRGSVRRGVDPIQVISAFQVPRVKFDPIRRTFYLAPGHAPLLGVAQVRSAMLTKYQRTRCRASRRRCLMPAVLACLRAPGAVCLACMACSCAEGGCCHVVV